MFKNTILIDLLRLSARFNVNMQLIIATTYINTIKL